MTNCDPRIEEFMEAVESEKIRASRKSKHWYHTSEVVSKTKTYTQTANS